MTWIKASWKKLNLSRKQRIALALVLIALVTTTGFYFAGDRVSAAEYMTGRIERGNLRNTVTATGTVQAVTTVQVGSQASGTISALLVDFNSQVKKGQVIAHLDPSVAQAQVQQARANLEQARAGLQQARAAVTNSRAGVTDAQARSMAAQSTVQNQRAGVSSAQANVAVLKAQRDDALSLMKQQQSLAASGIISRREFETAETAYKAAEARYQQAEAQLNQAVLSEQSAASAGVAQSNAQVDQSKAQVEQAQAQVQSAQAQVEQATAALRLAEVNLAHTTITSPIDGVVVSRDVNVGQTVAATLSAPTLFTIANDLTQMQVIANIDQADIGLVEQAKSVKFTVDAFPSDEFEGKIQQMRLNPVNVQNVVTYNVVIDVNNPEQKLKPGMTANLTVTIDERNNVLKVPNAALRFRPQEATGTRTGTGQGRRQQASGQQQAAGQQQPGEQQGGERRGERNFAPASAPVIEGQTRMVWVMGQDGKLQPRRIKVGLTDGASTEVVEGNLQEGEMVVTGQTVTGTAARTQTQNAAPGFGGAPRGGATRSGGGGRR